jgi:pimeloyl-ACP methyl ester carboxylesterase
MMTRRDFLTGMEAALLASLPTGALAQATTIPASTKRVRTDTLEIAYEENGPPNGAPVILLHGFPYDPRAYDGLVPRLVAAGLKTIVPYLRGYGATRFLSSATLRSGQQGAMGRDLLELMDVLAFESATWLVSTGVGAACVVAALWPERVRALVSCAGYTIQDIAAAVNPASPEQENRIWYQYYFHTERGRAGLQANRHDFCKLLWKLWSPNWKFDDATYDRTAASFDNADFVDVVIHSYRHRFGYVAGDPAYDDVERRLAKLPKIPVPTIVLHGGGDGVNPPGTADTQDRFFTGRYERRVIPVVGHDIPQEAPSETAVAVLDLLKG